MKYETCISFVSLVSCRTILLGSMANKVFKQSDKTHSFLLLNDVLFFKTDKPKITYMSIYYLNYEHKQNLFIK